MRKMLQVSTIIGWQLLLRWIHALVDGPTKVVACGCIGASNLCHQALLNDFHVTRKLPTMPSGGVFACLLVGANVWQPQNRNWGMAKRESKKKLFVLFRLFSTVLLFFLFLCFLSLLFQAYLDVRFRSFLNNSPVAL